MFLVLIKEDFNFEGVNCALPIVVQSKAIGYAPIYATVEAAREDYPLNDILEVKFSKKEE